MLGRAQQSASREPSLRSRTRRRQRFLAITPHWSPSWRCHKFQPKISKSRIPALLLARLAVDQRFQGQGIGEFLLLDVLRRAVVISEQTGLHAVVLDALTDRAKDFYLRYGFSELLDDPYHLYIPISTIIDLGLV